MQLIQKCFENNLCENIPKFRIISVKFFDSNLFFVKSTLICVKQIMESTLTVAAATLKQNPNLIEAVGNMWDNLTELSKSDPEKYENYHN